MNLSEISCFSEDQDKGRWLDLLGPYDGKPVGIRLLVAGPDSSVQARARIRLADDLADMADDEGRVPAQPMAADHRADTAARGVPMPTLAIWIYG